MASDFQLGLMDLVFLVASMLFSALIGLYFTNSNNSIESFMLGDRKLSVFPVAISLMTSCMSGLTLLGSSAELYYQGPSYSFVFMAMLLAGPITAYTILPVFYRMNELSLYQYLERRFGTVLKYFISFVFMMQMIFYNSVVLYLPAMALERIIGISKLYSILLLGLVCIIYSSIGGIKAVVWTDLFQAILMYASIITVGVMGTIDAGGIGQVFKNAIEGERLDLDDFLNLDLTTRHTLVAILIGSTLKHVYLMGVNQVQIQRALSLASLKQGQLSLVLCSLFTALFTLLSTYMGLVMYSKYRSCDPYLDKQIPRRDAIIVHYVSNVLNGVTGAKGIFVAGIFSATLSTLSSFSNSMSALAIEDYIKPVMRSMHKDHRQVNTPMWLAKALSAAFGLICIIVAYAIDRANSRLLQATTTMFGAIGVPFVATFFLGISTRFINQTGILVSLLVTLSFGSYITLYQVFFLEPLEPKLPIYYNEQCEKVFNGTMDSHKLLPLFDLYSSVIIKQKLAPLKTWFSIEKISYMTLPVIQFVMTIVVASLISLITCGTRQQVDDECLMSMFHKNKLEANNEKSANVVAILHSSNGIVSTLNNGSSVNYGSEQRNGISGNERVRRKGVIKQEIEQ